MKTLTQKRPLKEISVLFLFHFGGMYFSEKSCLSCSYSISKRGTATSLSS